MATEYSFTREEIWELEKRCRNEREIALNPQWKKIYENLESALDHLDAALARCTSPEAPSEATK